MSEESKNSIGLEEEKVVDFITEREWEFLNRALSAENLATTASVLGISRARGYDIIENVKKKWEKATFTHNRMISLYTKTRKQKHWLAKYLTIVKPQIPKLEDMHEPSES